MASDWSRYRCGKEATSAMDEQNVVWEWKVSGGQEPVRLVLTGMKSSPTLRVMRSRNGDVFLMGPDSTVVAALVRLGPVSHVI